MRVEFLRAKNVISEAERKLEDLMLDIENEIGELESKEFRTVVSNLIEKMEIALDDITYFQMPTKEGKLVFDQKREKYHIVFKDGEEGYPLSCGNTLEDFLEGEWVVGRVEHRYGGYYFTGGYRPFLGGSMKVRKRVTE